MDNQKGNSAYMYTYRL